MECRKAEERNEYKIAGLASSISLFTPTHSAHDQTYQSITVKLFPAWQFFFSNNKN